MNSMGNHTKLVPVQVTNREAVALIKERARRERRSFASAASVTIIESLGKKTPSDPAFLSQVVCKDTGNEAGLSSGKRGS
jgi:hypothetical protein